MVESTLAEQWLLYLRNVGPSIPDEAEVAYFAGAATVLMLAINEGVDVNTLVRECTEFAETAMLQDGSSKTIN